VRSESLRRELSSDRFDRRSIPRDPDHARAGPREFSQQRAAQAAAGSRDEHGSILQ
jgi:hypothetical protein